MPWYALLGTIVLLGACASSKGQGAPHRYALNTASSSCGKTPALCTGAAGEPPVVPAASVVRAAASTLKNAVTAIRVLDAALVARIRQALTKCANHARLEVLCRRMDCQSPTREQCIEQLGVDSKGQPITRAMRLGEEMHREALACVQQELGTLRPGGFSLEQRYRYDPESGEVEPIGKEEAEALLRQGRGQELRGTLVPDIVLHSGDPRKVQQVYELKFPCVNTDQPPLSRTYPKGHPYQGMTQEQAYESAFQTETFIVIPHVGVVR
jgi:hypothetical protein